LLKVLEDLSVLQPFVDRPEPGVFRLDIGDLDLRIRRQGARRQRGRLLLAWAEAGADAMVVHTRANTNAAALTKHFIADILVSVG
jgi:hypothetical protein